MPGEDGTKLARWGRSKGKTNQVLIYFELLSGPFAGRKEPWFGYFTKDAWKRTLESLRYAGFKGDNLADLENQPLDQQVMVVIEHNDHNDKVYARVAWVNRSGGAIKLADPMKPNDLKKFASEMKRHAAQISEVEGPKAERQAPTAASEGSGVDNGDPFAAGAELDYNHVEDNNYAPPVADDDIPF